MTGTVQVLADASQTRRAVVDLFTWADELSFAYAWMSTDDSKGSPWQALPLEKIVQGVVGLQFAGTDAAVLDEFFERVPDRVRVMYETAGTFHPKILVGVRGADARVVVGSSNFTRAAFSSNFEVNMMLEGSRTWQPITDLRNTIDGYFTSPKARKLDSDLLTAYRSVWEKPRPKPPALHLLPRRGGAKTLVAAAHDLDLGWSDYYNLLLDQDEREFVRVDGFVRLIPTASDDNAYLTEVRRAKAAFSTFGSLADMPLGIRQGVCGSGGESLGWFGSMRGAGYFKQLVNGGAAELSSALDAVPLDGEIDFDLVGDASEKALAIYGVALGVWTRLLCVKRPGVFVSVNSANRTRVREVFGKSPTTINSYLALVHRIHEFPWARSESPADPAEREVWEARVGLLDALLYEPAGHETT